MFQRLLYSLKYRLSKINSKLDLGKNNSIVKDGGFLVGATVEFHGNNNQLIIGKNSIVKNCLIYFKGDNCRFIVHDNVSIQSGQFYLEDDQSMIEIGNKTTIENAHIASTEHQSIRIGEDCMFANHVEIRNGDSHAIFEGENRINPAQDVIIRNHVWLGNNVTVLKGVTLEEQLIVASGSVVTKSVLSRNVLIGGVPAKILKTDVTWKRERM